MNAGEAFASLLEIGFAELGKTQQIGASYFAHGDTAHVRLAADRVEKIQAILGSIQELQVEWESVFPEPEPVIHPLIENTNQRTPPGTATPQDRYWLPILQALIEMGGTGPTGRVLDRVGDLMVNILNDFDCQNLPGRVEIRWRNSAAWSRFKMIQSGYLSDHAPRGIWEITEDGRRYFENMFCQKP